MVKSGRVHLTRVEDEKKRERVTQKWNLIQTESIREPGVLTDIDPSRFPDWIDPERVVKAQALIYNKENPVTMFSHLSGLLMVVQLPYGLFPLLVTHKSESVPALFDRYLSTMEHIRQWYRKDLVTAEGEGFKSIKQVRNLHKNIYDKMRDMEDDGTINIMSNQGRVWVSQYDMVVTQWAFIGICLQWPQECGLHGSKQYMKHVLTEINYLWRVIGFLNGIRDEYNLCGDDLEETVMLCDMIWRDVYVPVLKENPRSPMIEIGYQMSKGIIKSLNMLLQFSSADIFMSYWYRKWGFPEESVPQVSKMGHFYRNMMGFSLSTMYKSTMLKYLMNQYLEMKLNRTLKKRKMWFDKLTKKDKGTRYLSPLEVTAPPSACPFAHMFKLNQQQGQSMADGDVNMNQVGTLITPKTESEKTI